MRNATTWLKRVSPSRGVSTTLVILVVVWAPGLSSLGCSGVDSSKPQADNADASIKDQKTYSSVMAFDDGAVDAAAAERGAALFKEKGCSACHSFGSRVTGPDLAGVSKRRSRDWITDMVKDPVTMVREDSIGRELLGTYLVQMPNLKIDDAQATDLVEFMKSQEDPGSSGKEE